MAGRRRMWTAAAVVAAVALVASACGRSAGGNAAPGNISADQGPGGDHARGHQAGVVDHLGGLPGRELA